MRFKQVLNRAESTKVDFHVHTEDSPNSNKFWHMVDYLNHCFDMGVEYTALTDYFTNGLDRIWNTNILKNTFENFTPLEDKRGFTITKNGKTLTVFSGMEVAVRVDGQIYEVLMYDIPYDRLKNESTEDNLYRYFHPKFKAKAISTTVMKRIEKLKELNLVDKSANWKDYLVFTKRDENNAEIDVYYNKADDNFKTAVNAYIDKLLQGDPEVTGGFEYNGEMYEFGACNGTMRKQIKDAVEAQKADGSLNPQVAEFLEKYDTDPSAKILDNATLYARLVQNNPESFMYVPNINNPTLEELVQIAQNWDCTTIFAHPFNYPKYTAVSTINGEGQVDIKAAKFSENNAVQKQRVLKLMDRVIGAGVDGVEVLHGFNSIEQTTYLTACVQYLERKYNRPLLKSAGSDTHKKTRGENYGDHNWFAGQTVGLYEEQSNGVDSRLNDKLKQNLIKYISENNIEVKSNKFPFELKDDTLPIEMNLKFLHKLYSAVHTHYVESEQDLDYVQPDYAKTAATLDKLSKTALSKYGDEVGV